MKKSEMMLHLYIKQLKAGPVWVKCIEDDPDTHPATYPVLAIGSPEGYTAVYKETFKIYPGEIWRHIYDFDLVPKDTD